MKITRVVLSGVLGAVIVYAIVFVSGRLSHSATDLCVLSGSSITGDTGGWTWVLGAFAQIVIAIAAALVYGSIFEWVTLRAGAVVGLIIGIAHLVVAGIAVGFLPASGLIRAGVAPPGGFMEYRGPIVVIAFCVAHLVFGSILGALYGAPRHQLPRAAVWRDLSL
jgi:hypothetical protein